MGPVLEFQTLEQVLFLNLGDGMTIMRSVYFLLLEGSLQVAVYGIKDKFYSKGVHTSYTYNGGYCLIE